VWDLTYPENHFDTIYASNVHFFWKNPAREFMQLATLLKPHGRLVMVFQPRWTRTEAHLRAVAEKTKKQYQEAGLTNIELDFKKMTPVTCIYISGQKAVVLMLNQHNVIDCYNRTATQYAEQFMNELRSKHLDRLLLQAFVTENRGNSRIIDLGCGPGQTTRFMADCGAPHLLGVDLSPEMVRVAKALNPQLDFEEADMLHLPYADHSFGAAVGFYAIVHFDLQQLQMAFAQIRRVLAPGGQFLFSFHVGNQVVHREEFLGQPVDIDFFFFETDHILDLLTTAGFTLIDALERHPYPNLEYPSKRAYIWARTTA
jgi:SAM-dependent methyltransferase